MSVIRGLAGRQRTRPRLRLLESHSLHIHYAYAITVLYFINQCLVLLIYWVLCITVTKGHTRVLNSIVSRFDRLGIEAYKMFHTYLAKYVEDWNDLAISTASLFCDVWTLRAFTCPDTQTVLERISARRRTKSLSYDNSRWYFEFCRYCPEMLSLISICIVMCMKYCKYYNLNRHRMQIVQTLPIYTVLMLWSAKMNPNPATNSPASCYSQCDSVSN